nr:uncharacterized protein KIAA2013 homolog [Anolis sagrei ordinatus]XP_060632093.1 LOW QUALITY PROTEIN: uncharacterized protein KIAA2013 homolog [Anolis sagrei ordinatus]
MWLQQRLKGLPGLLSSSWARRLVAFLAFLCVAYWYLGGALPGLWAWRPGQPTGPGICLQAETRHWVAMKERGEAYLLPADGQTHLPPSLVGNGYVVLDAGSNRLWLTAPTSGNGPSSTSAAPVDVQALARLRLVGNGVKEAQATAVVFRDGSVRSVRCFAAGGQACVTVREEVLAHRSRPHLYVQRLTVANPTDRWVSFEVSGLNGAAEEQHADRRVWVSSGRATSLSSSAFSFAVASAVKALSGRVQVGPKATLEETVLTAVVRGAAEGGRPEKDALVKLREAARKELDEALRLPIEDLLQEHRRAWADLFVSGVEVRKVTDAHTPAGDTVNLTLYYVLSTSPAPLLDPSLGPEERERMEATLGYADPCFSGHATMHAGPLWPGPLSSVGQVLQLAGLWRLTLQKRGCKGLVSAGAHGLVQGMVLSFGGLQFTENHLQFQADPDVLRNSYALRGIRYNKDLINLVVRLDAEGKPVLHAAVEVQEKPVRLYACEGGCANDPVELTSQPHGHTFPVMVTRPITPLLYISTDLVHLQDLRHTLHLKAILAHEEHMAQQDPGLPFLFWFSIASLITLFHLFLFKLIYNEYCGPGAKPLFRSKV